MFFDWAFLGVSRILGGDDCVGGSFWGLLGGEAPTQVFSCGYCEVFGSNSGVTPLMAVSDGNKYKRSII